MEPTTASTPRSSAVLDAVREHVRGNNDCSSPNTAFLDAATTGCDAGARRAVERGADGKVRRISGTARNITQTRNADASAARQEVLRT